MTMLTSVLLALFLCSIYQSAPVRNGESKESSNPHLLHKLAKMLHLTKDKGVADQSNNPSDVPSKMAPSTGPYSGSRVKSTPQFQNTTSRAARRPTPYTPSIPSNKPAHSSTSSRPTNRSRGSYTASADSSEPVATEDDTIGAKRYVYTPHIPSKNNTPVDPTDAILLTTAANSTGTALPSTAVASFINPDISSTVGGPGVTVVVGGDGGTAAAVGGGGGGNINCGDLAVSCLGVVGSCVWKGIKPICDPTNWCCCCDTS